MAKDRVPWKALAMRDGLMSGRDETLARAGFTGPATAAAVRPYVPCRNCTNPILANEWHYCTPCYIRLHSVPKLAGVMAREHANRELLRAVDRWPESSMLISLTYSNYLGSVIDEALLDVRALGGWDGN